MHKWVFADKVSVFFIKFLIKDVNAAFFYIISYQRCENSPRRQTAATLMAKQLPSTTVVCLYFPLDIDSQAL